MITFKPFGTPFTIMEWKFLFWIATASFVVAVYLFVAEHNLRVYHEERAAICKGDHND